MDLRNEIKMLLVSDMAEGAGCALTEVGCRREREVDCAQADALDLQQVSFLSHARDT